MFLAAQQVQAALFPPAVERDVLSAIVVDVSNDREGRGVLVVRKAIPQTGVVRGVGPGLEAVLRRHVTAPHSSPTGAGSGPNTRRPRRYTVAAQVGPKWYGSSARRAVSQITRSASAPGRRQPIRPARRSERAADSVAPANASSGVIL